MSKLMSLIRRAPKRLSAVAIMVAAAVIVPAVVFAWGPHRETFTMQQPSDHVQFNSITNNPGIGDERNFVGIREVGSANVWYDNVNVQDGKEYLVRMYVHNNAAANLNLVAENVTAKFNLPTNTSKSIQVNGFLSASNIGADGKSNKGKYGEVYDHATFNSDRLFNLSYVKNSLKYENNVFGTKGAALSESIFTSNGAKLGYDKLDGKIPGCFQYDGYVTFKVKPQVQKTTNFTLNKMVSKHGENKWVENYKAQPGEKVDFMLVYKNTGEVSHKDVTFRDTLPKGLSYVTSSTTYGNAGKQNVKASDNIANGTGINVGGYAPGANAWAIFSAKVANKDQLACGTNKLVNTGKVNTGGYAVEDTATVTVDKYCPPAPVVKYTCDSLAVSKLSDTKFRFTTNYTVQNATFKSVTYVIRDASGKEVERKTSTAKTLDYTRTAAGKYTVQATITVTVNGKDVTVTSTACKKPFEVVAKPVVKYTCDSLAVSKLSDTKFRFTTNYTAQNATFKSVTYVIRDASGKEVERKTSTAKTLDYTRTAPGKYTVQATVTFTVNGKDVTATSNACKKPFEVVKPTVYKYTCNALAIKSISRTEVTFSVAYSVENAKFKSVTYVVRDASGRVVNTLTSTKNTLNYTQTKAGKYTVQATVHFTVNGVEKTATSEKCKGTFTVKDLPKEITVCELATKKPVTIKESEFNPTKHSKDFDDCKVTPIPETIEVCDTTTKTVVTINKEDFDATKHSTDLSKCAETPVVPPELPQTGAGDVVAILGAGALISSVAYYVASRRALGL